LIYILLTYLLSPLIFLLIAIKKKKTIKKILVIQTAKIGDLISSTALFREIKKRYPDAHLTVMVSPLTTELLKYNPYVDEVKAIRDTNFKGLLGKLRLSYLIYKGGYDIAVCLNPNVPFAIALLLGLVPVRLSVMPDFAGITFKLTSVFFTHLERHIKGGLVIETFMHMLKAIGVKSNDISREVYKSENADKKVLGLLNSKLPGLAPRSGAGKTLNSKLIGIAISSGNKLKELGAGRVTTITNALLDDMDVYIVFIGSVQDRNIANIILNSINKKDRVINAVGNLNLNELPALLERLSLFIGVDTGITYMADALSIPLIDIAGPSDMNDQRPLGVKSIIIQKDLPCVPCSHTFKAPYSCKLGDRRCITLVSISEIVENARELLKESLN